MKVTVATKQMCAYYVSPCVALYVALTLHYVALKRPSFFCTDVHYRALSGVQPLGEGLYAAPFLGMETRHGFGAAEWVLSGSMTRGAVKPARRTSVTF